MAVLWCLAGDHVEEQRLQFGRDRAAFAVADLAIVEFTYRRDFCCGAGEEGFVAAIHFIAGDTFFNDFDAEVACHRQHGVAGDTVEAGCQIWSVDLAVLDDEDIFAGTF